MKLTFAIALSLIVFVCTPPPPSRAARGDGRIVKDVPYVLPSFGDAEGVDYFVSREEYERVANDTTFEMREIWYTSDGLEVSAYVYRPRDTKGAKRPVVVYNRGSYLVGPDLGYKLAPMFHRLALAGFVVVAPLYRESNGAKGRDEVGGADLDDLMNVVPLVAHLRYADQRNLFLYGESRGAVMTFEAIRDGFPANAAATFGGFTDFDAYIRSAGPQLDALVHKIWPDYDERKAEIVRHRSAVYWADRLDVPLLVMHGGADQSVDPEHSRMLDRLLTEKGKTHELVVFDGDNHVLRRNQEERDRRAVAWFRRFMR